MILPIPIVNFNYSYDSSSDKDIEERFFMDFKPVTRSLMSWPDEVVATSEMIANNTEKPIYLCLSGGIDSEVMALAFLKAGIEFKVLTIKNGTNLHDIRWATAFCKKNKLTQKFVDVDVTTLHKKYMDRYRAVSLFRYLQLFLVETVENLGGTAVLGGGEQVYYTKDDQIHIKYDPGFVNVLNWCKDNEALHFPYFHMQNPELLASYMKVDLIDFLLTKPEYFTAHHWASTEKMLVYHRYWEMTRRTKFDGFENHRILKKYIDSELRSTFPDIQGRYFPVSQVKSQLGIS